MKHNKNLAALIPARSGSKRIKNKNFKLFAGIPLLLYSVMSAKIANIFDKVIISTDVPDIVKKLMKECKEDIKNITIHKRPVKIAGANSPDCEWIADVFDNCLGWDKYSHYMILRPTNPFRTPQLIVRAWSEYQNVIEKNISMKSVQLVSERPEKMWMKKNKGELAPLFDVGVPVFELQSADMLEMYVQNGAIDICPISIIKNNRNRYIGDIIQPFMTDKLEGFDLNTEFDWAIAELILNIKLNKRSKILH
jgi:CMP-N,N'-diacetyllegionaminic acid synthase